MSTLRKIRFLIVAAGCLIGGPILLVRSFADVPAFERLLDRTGPATVQIETHRSRWSTTEFPVLTIEGAARAYRFPARFAKESEVPRLLPDGEIATVRVDPDEFEIWQLERGDKVLVAYDEVRAAVAESRRLDRLLGVVLLAAGGLAIFLFVRRLRRPR